MKLIHLYIENFGGLHQYELDFSEGLTVLQEDNGFGKTTLAEFIRAMFYGFPRKGKTLEKSRRQKYTPWQGGKFGGHLTFQLEGKQYRIERTFGATPKGDQFQVIDLTTNRKTDRFTEEIGLEIFGLDTDSFERSTYMPQNQDGDNLTTDNIRAKLSDLVQDTGDVGNFEKALGALRAKRTAYVPYRGNGGLVAEAAGRITQVQNRLDRMVEAEKEYKMCREEIIRLEAECGQGQEALKEIRSKITLASQMAALEAVHQQHQGLENRKIQLEGQLATLRAFYPDGFPEDAELEAAMAAADRRAVLEAQRVTTQEDLAAVRFEEENREMFRDSVPGDRELENCRSQVESYRILKAELANLESVHDDKLHAIFESGALEEERLEKLDGQRRELEKLRGLLETLAAPISETFAQEVPKRTLPLVILAIVGLLGMVGGIVLLTMGNYLVGGGVLALGLAGIIGAIFVGMKVMMAKELARQRQAQAATEMQMQYTRRRGALEDQIRTLESKLTRELGHGDFGQAIMNLRMARQRYLDSLEQDRKRDQKRNDLIRKLQQAENTIEAFLERFYREISPDMFPDLLADLQRKSESYLRAKTRAAEWQKRKQNQEVQLRECDQVLRGFFGKWHLNADGDLRKALLQIRDESRQEVELRNQLKKLAQELESFRKDHDRELYCPVQELELDGAALKWEEEQLLEAVSDLTRQLLRKRQRAQELRSQMEEIPTLENQLELWQNRKVQGQKNARLLDDTMDFLQKAKDSLSGNYLGPIQKYFRSYMTALDSQEEKFLITPDLDVRLERQGQSRELGYFSAGQSDLVMLCMRFALVDALFTGEKPFVILDDPFVNLDDRHTAQALELLKKLAKKRQILYLTCNSSRNIG